MGRLVNYPRRKMGRKVMRGQASQGKLLGTAGSVLASITARGPQRRSHAPDPHPLHTLHTLIHTTQTTPEPHPLDPHPRYTQTTHYSTTSTIWK
ncbi:hypothetical protein Pmani_028022 [Petrolisthes manimaculis]|uniref:Uncharacterized protein n=1 Tax=Petrolisthes manimaculis TaxID=1843537 RepID=A0AAE1TVX3_9EUCA|nr:hypothetical protein Pmani_028022 [Petrolisthes manimaculis]